MKNLSFISVGFIALLQACSTTLNTPLLDTEYSAIQKAHIHNAVTQDEVIPAVKVSNTSAAAAGGGLLGALIVAKIDAEKNKSRNKSAQAIIEPLWNETLDYDYRAMSSEHIENTLGAHFTLANPGESKSFVGLSKHELIDEVNALDEGEVYALVYPRYALIDDSRKLQTSLEARIFKKPTVASNAMPKPIYQNAFFFESEIVGDGGESSMNLWTADNASLFKSNAQANIEVLAELLSYDLKAPDESCNASQTIMMENGYTYQPFKVKGVKIEASEGVHTVRHKTGYIYATKAQPAFGVTAAKCK